MFSAFWREKKEEGKVQQPHTKTKCSSGSIDSNLNVVDYQVLLQKNRRKRNPDVYLEQREIYWVKNLTKSRTGMMNL